MQGKLFIDFDAVGNVKSDAVGFTGTACEDATRTILAGLGQMANETKKAEYYGGESATITDQQRVASRW